MIIRTSQSTVELPNLLSAAFPQSRPGTRAALATAAHLHRLGPGQTFVRQDDPSAVGLVLEGHIAARRVTSDGRHLIVRIAGRGELAPLLPLSTRRAAADGVALSQSLAAVWRGEEIRALALSDPGLGVDLLDHVLSSFDVLVGQLDELAYRDTVRRVARVLHLRGELFFGEQPVLTRAHLPILVGASREMIGRVLRLLERRQIVSRIGTSRLKLLDPAALVVVAEAGIDEPLTDGSGPRTNRLA